MGRPEAQVPPGPASGLAQHLRDARGRCGLTYCAMADASGKYSAATFARAASGKSIPRRPVVEEFMQVCRADPSAAVVLWKTARKRKAAVATPRPRRNAAVGQVVMTGDLAAAMRAARLAAGQPSLRELDERARLLGYAPLATSTVSDILAGKRTPTWPLLRAFLLACDVPGALLQQWYDAWFRVRGGPDLYDIVHVLADVLSDDPAGIVPPGDETPPDQVRDRTARGSAAIPRQRGTAVQGGKRRLPRRPPHVEPGA